MGDLLDPDPDPQDNQSGLRTWVLIGRRRNIILFTFYLIKSNN